MSLDAKSAACASPLLRHRAPAITLIVLGLALFAGVAYVVERRMVLENLDRPALAFMRRLEANAPSWAVSLNDVVSHLGNLGTTALAIVLGAVWGVRREKRKVYLLLGTVVTTEILWLIMIYAFDRPRPAQVATVLGEISLPGFPSGHTWMVMAFNSLLVYVYWDWLKARGVRAPAIAGVALLTLVNGFSRLFVSSHYLTDVMASLGIGVAWTLASLMAVDQWLCNRQRGKVQDESG